MTKIAIVYFSNFKGNTYTERGVYYFCKAVPVD